MRGQPVANFQELRDFDELIESHDLAHDDPFAQKLRELFEATSRREEQKLRETALSLAIQQCSPSASEQTVVKLAKAFHEFLSTRAEQPQSVVNNVTINNSPSDELGPGELTGEH